MRSFYTIESHITVCLELAKDIINCYFDFNNRLMYHEEITSDKLIDRSY